MVQGFFEAANKLLYYVYYRNIVNVSLIEYIFLPLSFPMVCKNSRSNKTNICQYMQNLHANRCKKNQLTAELVLRNYVWLSICIFCFIFPIYLLLANLIMHFPPCLMAFWEVKKITLLDSLSYHKHEIQIHWMKDYDSVHLSWQCLLVIVYYGTPS